MQYLKYTNPMDDGRRKMHPRHRAEIISKYKSGSYSQMSLASEYGVSRTLIQSIVNPEGHRCYRYVPQDRAIKRESMRKWRAKKKRLGLTKSKSCDRIEE